MIILKKVIAGFLAGSIVFGAVSALAADLNIKVTSLPIKFFSNGVDKTPQNNSFNNTPASFVYNGNVYIPIGLASNLSGVPFSYDSKSGSVHIGQNLTSTYMSDAKPFYISTNSYYLNKQIQVGGQSFTKNIAFFAVFNNETSFAYNLNGKYRTLETIVGLSDDANKHDTTLTILGDDRELWTGNLKAGDLPQNLNVDVSGVLKLQFKYTNTGGFGSMVVVANPILK